MRDTDSSPITDFLREADAPDRSDAAEALLPHVYTELRRVARAMMSRERPGQTLQPTALVHEAYLHVVGQEDPQWDGRRHFFAAATEAMRRILINQARRRACLKRGGDAKRVEMDEAELAIDGPRDDVLEVDEALQKLEAVDPRTRQIVNLRYFAGFTIQETADALDVSTTTIERELRFIRAWLKDALSR